MRFFVYINKKVLVKLDNESVVFKDIFLCFPSKFLYLMFPTGTGIRVVSAYGAAPFQELVEISYKCLVIPVIEITLPIASSGNQTFCTLLY